MIDRLRDLILTIAPELAESPLYLLRSSDHPRPMDATAWANPRNLPMPSVQARLEARGDWHGQGNAIFFADHLFDGDFETLAGTAVHETAHLLPLRDLPTGKPPIISERARLALSMAVAMLEESGEWPPWRTSTGHGAAFVRRVCHLRWRALVAGVPIPFEALAAAGAFYGMSHIVHYDRALGAEPEKFCRARFEALEILPPPAEFTRLWINDQQRWMDQHEKNSTDG